MKNLWAKKDADIFFNQVRRLGIARQFADCVYASRLLGRETQLVQHGGGNTSVKLLAKTFDETHIDAMFVKASGYNLEQITAEGFVGVNQSVLDKLKTHTNMSDEFLINALGQSRLSFSSPNPSVETLVHSFIPARYVFHTHPVAILALTNQKNGSELIQKATGGKTIVIPYVMSGFPLALQISRSLKHNKDNNTIVVLKHGVFTFGDTAQDAYDSMIRVVTNSEKFIRSTRKKLKTNPRKPSFKLENLAPVLRGALISSSATEQRYILSFRNSPVIKNFLGFGNLSRLVKCGPVTPDHAIWTKPKALFLPSNCNSIEIVRAVKNYKRDYERYFEKNNRRYSGKKVMRDSLPRVIFVDGLGVFGVGESLEKAHIVSELAETFAAVALKSESLGFYAPASLRDIFDIEYWGPETAKLAEIKNSPLSGHVVVITGGGSGIGAATATRFKEAGAEVVIMDSDRKTTSALADNLGAMYLWTDVTDKNSLRLAFDQVVQEYGGLDIVISNAGAAWEGEIGTVPEKILRQSFEINFFAHQSVSQAAVEILKKQNLIGKVGGVILFNLSKQAINPGRNFGPYGLPKAATMFLLKQYALDHGKDGIRVAGVNADRIRSGLLTDKLIAKRANARGLSNLDYVTGNLLGKEVLAEDVAKAFLDLALSKSTTGAVMTVDGGNIEASLR